jgi:hypothetical protein
MVVRSGGNLTFPEQKPIGQDKDRTGEGGREGGREEGRKWNDQYLLETKKFYDILT